jgi:4-amino-4-deoxy-L-arabinose transferase-like glycosyltransferase
VLTRPLTWLTAAALVVRAAFLLLEPSTGPVADERMWVVWGADVLPSPEVSFSPVADGFRLIFHPPLYPYFIGAVKTAFGGELGAVKVVQVLLCPLIVPVVGLVGTRIFGARAGLAAAALAAFYPELVWFSVHFWVEGLFVVLLWAGLERLTAADERGSLPLALVAGLVFGVSILARETALYFLPLAAAWLAFRRAGGKRRALALLLGAFFVVAPWTYRNWAVFGAFVPVSTAGALNLWQGNTRMSRQEVYEEYWAVRGRIQKYEHARRRGFEAIWARQPLWLLEKLRDEMPMFWEADSQPLVHIRRGAYGRVPGPFALAASAVVLVPYLAVLAAFVAGLAVVPLNRGSVLLLGFIAYYTLLHVATHGYARYRLPVMPALFLFAGAALAGWRSGERFLVSARRRAAAGLVGLVLLGSLVPSLRLLADHRAMGIGDPGDRPPDEAEEP